ncbi:hypothetical protein [uncultured Mailhella sp.]|uniref:hypothetical protein n=1 Tax=uncultured Mailhella sp. TaxID=1981031 RepID=UPI0025DA8FD6|nr:hypothetical protein [uncultured Mailhella sp.]
MEGGSDKDLLKELADYRNGLQNLLASEAVKTGFLKDSVRSIPELSGLVRTFFEHCIREYHSLYDHVEPLAVLGSCCFAGAAAANLWDAVGEELLKSNLFVLLSRERGMKYLDDTALELAGMPGGTSAGDRLAACIKGNWSIMALATWSGTVKGRSAEEAMLFLQATAQVLFILGESIVLAGKEK